MVAGYPDSDPVIEVYTRRTCPRCDEMKASLRARGVKFAEKVLDYDVSTKDVVARFPGAKVLPLLVISGHLVGGLPELEDLIERDQLKFLTHPL